MKLTAEQQVICRVFGRRDKSGKVHCRDCPMRLDDQYAECLKIISKQDAIDYGDWNGSPYPALGEYEGRQDEQNGTD